MGIALPDMRCFTLAAGSARPRDPPASSDGLASSPLTRRALPRISPAQDLSWRVAATGAPDRPASGAPPLQDGQTSRASGSTGQAPSSPPAPAPAPTPSAPSFDDVMSFDGAPEIINGRLAMLGIVWGAFVELTQGASFWDQIQDPSQYGLFYAGVSIVAVTVASLPPLLRAKRAPAPRFLFFTEDAEKANGRAAMLGIVGVFFLEYAISLIAKLF